MAAGRYTSVLTIRTFLFCFSMSQRASLPAVVVLPAPCSPASMTTTGRCARRLRPVTRLAHEAHEFLVHHLDEGLPRRQAFGDLHADRARLDGLGEALDHGQRDVGIEQREANLPDGVGDIVLAQAAAAGERLQRHEQGPK